MSDDASTSASAAGPSAKALGKRRALPAGSLCLCIRFTWPSTPDLPLILSDPSLTVAQFKSSLLTPQRPQLSDKRLRLIHAGRVLSEGVRLLPWLEELRVRKQQHYADPPTLFDASSEHQGSSSNEDKEEVQQGKSPEMPIWIHCSVAEVPPDTPQEDSVPDDASMPGPLRGFDRLREAGFTTEEIDALRQQFAANRPDTHVERDGVVGSEDEHARAMEEMWMDGSGNQPTEQSEEFTTLLKGLCLGFMFPLIPMLWFRGRLFSRRMQMGIVAGMFINGTFGVLRMLG